MLSRRSVRVKVMQALYNLSRDKDLSYNEALKRYRKSVESTYDLYLFNVLLLAKIAAYAKIDASKIADKLVPTDKDKSFRPKFGDNDLIDSVLKSDGFLRIIKMRLVENRIDKDQVRRFYKEFAKTEDYQTYLTAPDNDDDTRELLLKLYKFWTSEETFNDLMEEQFASWLDDKSLVIGAIKKTIKAMPLTEEFYEAHRPDEEAVKDFGENLLHKVHYEGKKMLEIIQPTLKNWDAERVAVLDMISLKMAVCELTEFNSIPTKVTLNEYVEISKLYSTDKSKDFINGVLDRLMKELQKDGKINKQGRGLID